MGITRACGLVGISRSLFAYESKRTGDVALTERMKEMAALKRRYGYRRIHIPVSYTHLNQPATGAVPSSQRHREVRTRLI